MDVVAYDTIEPLVIFAASDLDRRAATTMIGEGVDLRCVDGIADALAVIDGAAGESVRIQDGATGSGGAGEAASDDPAGTEADERVDCVVTADSLRDGSGIDLASAIRDRDDDLPVLYVPATGSVEDAEAATAAGATVYLPRDRAADGELRERIDDVVDHYDRRRQLARERRMFEALLESAPLPLYVKDAEARHVAVSSYVASGYERSPLGATDVELYGEHDPRAIDSYRDDCTVIETGDPILEKEAPGTSADGEEGWYSTTKHPLRTADGDVQGLVGVTRPITAMKERERQLERQRWRLQQFAQFTSTELREPVTAALDALDRARAADGSLVADADPSLDEIDDALDRMQSLIDTLLTMARPQSEPAELDWIDLEVAVRQSWNAIEDVDATLECAIDERLEIRADPDQLHRFLEQLFRDALESDAAVAEGDAAGASSVTRVRVGLTEMGFAVEDDGQFREYDEDAEFDYQGAGHRVAIARDIADAHGWSIGTTRGRDDGTRFVVEDALFRPAGLPTAIEGSSIPLDRSGDVGDAAPPGDATQSPPRDDAGAAWTVLGGGRNVWQDVREFHGVWAAVEGDVRVEARVTDLEPVHERCKAGVALFDPADGGVLSSLGLTGTVETESIGRSRADEPITGSVVPGWEGSGLYYRIDRVGDRTVCSVSDDGEDWTVVDHRRFHGPESVAAGLAVCSHSPERLTTASFEAVRVVELEVSE
ncbi:hypothetical protein GCM10028857_27900 [Salinarchaeum chitinilyticum]